jgi:N-acetylmuramoyl-L-alanine amidase
MSDLGNTKKEYTGVDIIEIPLTAKAFSPETNSVLAIIVHCVGFPTVEAVINCFNEYGVSSQYLVPEKSLNDLLREEPFIERYLDVNKKYSYCHQPPVIRFVQEKMVAYHAGKSNFAGIEGYNNRSIGIEFQSSGFIPDLILRNSRYGCYTPGQITTGIALINAIVKAHNLPPQAILAHSTIAPNRKVDPGPNFFWRELAANGLGYQPTAVVSDINVRIPDELYLAKLKEIGFGYLPADVSTDDNRALLVDTLRAFALQFATGLYRTHGESLLLEPNLRKELWGYLDAFDLNVYQFLRNTTTSSIRLTGSA